MRTQAKNAAEYYALGAIDLSQLLDYCLDLEEAKEAVDYAESYYLEYEICMRRKYMRKEQIEKAWRLYDDLHKGNLNRLNRMYWHEQIEEPNFPSEEQWLDDMDKGYSDEELQGAYDQWEFNRSKSIFRIGYIAAAKKVSDELIHKFFKDYHCNTSQDLHDFWCGYFTQVYGLEDIMM